MTDTLDDQQAWADMLTNPAFLKLLVLVFFVQQALNGAFQGVLLLLHFLAHHL
jgi:hypothetical protein